MEDVVKSWILQSSGRLFVADVEVRGHARGFKTTEQHVTANLSPGAGAEGTIISYNLTCRHRKWHSTEPDVCDAFSSCWNLSMSTHSLILGQEHQSTGSRLQSQYISQSIVISTLLRLTIVMGKSEVKDNSPVTPLNIRSRASEPNVVDWTGSIWGAKRGRLKQGDVVDMMG